MAREHYTCTFPDVSCDKETSKALHILGIRDDKPLWVPKSVVHDDSEVYAPGHQGTLIIAEWFALAENLI